MGYSHRKLLEDCPCNKRGDDSNCNRSVPSCHDKNPRQPMPKSHPLPPPPPPLTPSSPRYRVDYKGGVMTNGMTVIGSMLSAALLLGIFFAFIRCHFNSRNQSRRRRRSFPVFFGTQDDFSDEDRGPHLQNPIWYINTVGLPQSVIESITAFKYKKDEGLIEGTECSVCLNEFEEDESLRLLPKCSHAFHLPCIDTWLRSHKNCPLCRAPVVCETMVAQASEPEPNSINSGPRNEILVENSENHGVSLGRNDVSEGGTTSELRSCPPEDGNTSDNSKKSLVHSNTVSFASDSQVSSDLSGVQGDIQSMRRSVSLDLASAMEIYSHVAGLATATHKHHGSLDTELRQLKHPKGKKSLSISKLMKSSSNGRSLSKGPISMKRSFSSGGKFFSSKQSRSQDSVLT